MIRKLDQVFAIGLLTEKASEKDRKLFMALMDLEKFYDRVDGEGFIYVNVIYRGKASEGVL